MTKRSPLKDKPLHNPGESAERWKLDLVLDRVLYPLVVALFLSIMALVEFARSITDSPPMPWLWGVTAAVAVVWAAIRVRGVLPQLSNLRQGILGEKAVGQYLERLRTEGYEVFHDLQGTGFNIDHVVIGPTGTYTIETKTWSKPVKGESKIRFDGEAVTAGGSKPDRDPVIQAKAQASWLRDLLQQSTGKQIPVRPVILYPGWYVEQAKGTTRDIWVLNPKALPDFLRHSARILEPEEVKIAAFHLSRYARAEH